jgi:hypothetical protein
MRRQSIDKKPPLPFPRASLLPRRLRLRTYVLLLLLSSLIVLTLILVKFKLSGDWDGIYLLKGNKGFLLEVKDSVFLGEYDRVLVTLEYASLFSFLRPGEEGAERQPHLKFHWVERSGRGFIRSFFPDNTEFLVCFGRYVDSAGLTQQGLFVGGGLPFGEYDRDKPIENETGMAFFDGKEWQHLWCNVNESINPGLHPGTSFAPSSWKFLGSKIIRGNRTEVVLASAHEVVIEGQPLRIGRYLFYRAGDKYIVLAVKITNTGKGIASYIYIYGDEPWVGDFGTSMGNVGWYRDGLVTVEGRLDSSVYNYAGYWDRGNPLCISGRIFSGVANFIEWGGDFQPDLVYFSNTIGRYADTFRQVPLCDPANRVLFLQYGPRIITPKQTDLVFFVIGMADPDPSGGLPKKPDVSFNPANYPLLRRGPANPFGVE